MITAIFLAAAILYLFWTLREPYLTLRRPNGQAYLTRWCFVQSRWCSIYLHRIDGPDPDRDLHNHPWDAIVLVLRKPGKYIQEVAPSLWASVTVQDVGRVNLLGAGYHAIREIAPGTWTLCICGPRQARGWGFRVEDEYMVEHVDWQTYVQTHQKGVLNAKGTVSGRAL